MELVADSITLTLINEPQYTLGSADNLRPYQKEYSFADKYKPTSLHGIICRGKDGKEYSCLLAGQGGGTGIHEHSAVVADSVCYIAVGDSLCALELPQLDLRWNLKVDEATCFGVYYSGKHRCLFSHGELQISRVAFDGKIVWTASGKDIFSEGFQIFDDRIEAIDFNKEVYRIEIESGQISLES